ncbi:MAG: 6,7-dimethyl-8-ribityllumazine synthase [Flavobacteriaceae bacterium]|jgi:6,7-dimethyl-8-ribityllumazine synthase|nr:6,7-dimethyl-8-ribityllumazine synthase [Flavobacteriaceae bacterium]MDG1774929.1 6,7-dimethyl-8-ribityllumazine synthase [Flavobacteriaceae bacterium]MDG2415442.1 6,7-dimethyl-8-ribityllumazine synthase [Flavobacteriaceae bacterium]
MATALSNLSDYNAEDVPNANGLRIGLIVSQWNKEITHSLYKGAVETLISHGVKDQDIITFHVPGSFELPFGASKMIDKHAPDAVIVIGSVIQGETKHFDFVCQATAQGVMDLNIQTQTPVIFCVLTDNTLQQAQDRSGGKHGNKGVEAAVAAIQMATLS